MTKASLQVLAELDPQVLASGHGTPLTGPDTAATLRALATEQIRESTDARQGSVNHAAESSGTDCHWFRLNTSQWSAVSKGSAR